MIGRRSSRQEIGLLGLGPAGGGGTSASSPVQITLPAQAANLAVGTAFTIRVVIAAAYSAAVTAVAVYLEYPDTLVGGATEVSPGTWEIDYTPDLLEHGAHYITAIATVAAGTLSSAPRGVNFIAIAQPGTWAANHGVYYDFRLLPAEIGATLTAPIAPLEGSAVVTPVNGPTLRIGAGLQKVVEFVNASSQALTGVIDTMVGSDVPITVAWRQTSTSAARRGWGFGDSASNQNFLEFHWTSAGVARTSKDAQAFESTQSITWASDLSAGGSPPHTLVLTSIDGTTYRLYVDGVEDANSPLTLDTLATACNQFAIGAGLRGAVLQQPMDGYVQCWACKRIGVSGAEALEIHNHFIAGDLAPPVGTPIMAMGDYAAGDSVNGGFRREIYDQITAESYAVDFVGRYARGAFADNQHEGASGNTMADVLTEQVDIYLGTGAAFAGVELMILLVGLKDLSLAGTTLSQFQTDYAALLEGTHTKLVSSVPTARICVGTFIPYNTPEATAIVNAMNGGLAEAIWDAFDAAHPSNTLLRCDPFSALGGAWSSTYFQDFRTPNTAGYNLIANHATYGIIPAIDAYLATIG